MTTLTDAREFLVELISQLFHADVLITEQAERIEALEAEVGRLRRHKPPPAAIGATAWAKSRGEEGGGCAVSRDRTLGRRGSGGAADDCPRPMGDTPMAPAHPAGLFRGCGGRLR